jgi:hypothetical protein
MDTLEFMGHMNPRKLTSFAEDFKREQADFLNDESKRKGRKFTSKLVIELTYERFSDLDLGP